MIQNLYINIVNKNAIIPCKGTKNSAGYDLFSVDDIEI
jgi:hypothetical protein